MQGLGIMLCLLGLVMACQPPAALPPVQHVTALRVEDITPDILQTPAKLRFSGLTLGASVPPEVFVYVTQAEAKNGIWGFSQAQNARQHWSGEDQVFESMQAYPQGLFTLKTETERFCLQQRPLQQLELPAEENCFPLARHLWRLPEFAVHNSTGFVFSPFLPKGLPSETYTTVYQTLKISQGKAEKLMQTQPAGLNKQVRISSTRFEAVCLGLCHRPGGYTNGSWQGYSESDAGYIAHHNPQGKFEPLYAYPVVDRPDVVHPYPTLPLPENDAARLLLLRDGSADSTSFWQPEGLSVDQHQNLYIKDSLSGEDFIRRISTTGETRTLISQHGRTDFGYPVSQASLQAILNADESPEPFHLFIVDAPRDWLYILSRNLYRFDLRNGTLTRLAHWNQALKDLPPHISHLNIDAEGHLYLLGYQNKERIYKILIPQPEGR